MVFRAFIYTHYIQIYKYISRGIDRSIEYPSALVQNRIFSKRFTFYYICDYCFIPISICSFILIIYKYTSGGINKSIEYPSVLVQNRIFPKGFYFFICDYRLITICSFIPITYIQQYKDISRGKNKNIPQLLFKTGCSSKGFDFFYICDNCFIPINICSFVPILYKYTRLKVEGHICL